MTTEQFSKSPFSFTLQSRMVRVNTIKYLKRYIAPDGDILDVGRYSQSTKEMGQVFGYIDNTAGDLDIPFIIPKPYYRYIIYSHTIEHQYNPLFTLLELRKVMDRHTRLFIMLPERSKLLWINGHFHEIDKYRMGLLIKRAGMQIVSYKRIRCRQRWWFYLTGIRPLIRLFNEYNAYYLIQIDETDHINV